jgi:hypothetical protein
MKIPFHYDLVLVKDKESSDEIPPEIVIHGIAAVMEFVIRCPLPGGLSQWIYEFPFSYPVRAQAETIHVVEIIEIVGLCHIAVLVHEQASRIHFADLDLARRLCENTQA